MHIDNALPAPSSAMRIDKAFAAGVLAFIARRLWGFSPNLMPCIAESLGGFAALAWFVKNMPRYENTLKTLGPMTTHVVCSAISIQNGCAYCVYGHSYALNLHYYKASSQLFPLDEMAIAKPVALEKFLAVATDVELANEVKLARRALELHAGAAVNDDVDKRLAHLVTMFSVLNACGIRYNTPPDEAHDPINRDVELKKRYAAARAS
jgi:hypothetical protein